jgi:hypothetical protein
VKKGIIPSTHLLLNDGNDYSMLFLFCQELFGFFYEIREKTGGRSR